MPNEAFQLRHEIGERGTLPEPLAQKAQDSPSSANESDYGIVVEKVNRNVEKNIREDILAIKPFISTVTTMDFVELIVDMLKQYAEKVCVCVLLQFILGIFPSYYFIARKLEDISPIIIFIFSTKMLH